MKTLNVKAVKKEEIDEHWGYNVCFHFLRDGVFVRCNAKGEINWESSSVYSLDELRKHGNVKVLI